MKKIQFLAMGLLYIWIISSCTPDGAEYIDELDIVYTNYDVTYDFSANNTFAVPDKIVKISNATVNNPNEGFEPDFVSPVYTSAILASIRSNMREAGYTEVDKDANPDIIILPTVFQTDQIYFYYDWWYWNWFYPGWVPGWGWWYPGYYPPQVSRIRTGTLMMQMTHPGSAAESDQITVSWTGVINGLLEGDANSINSRVNASIDQAFAQSPYLAK